MSANLKSKKQKGLQGIEKLRIFYIFTLESKGGQAKKLFNKVLAKVVKYHECNFEKQKAIRLARH